MINDFQKYQQRSTRLTRDHYTKPGWYVITLFSQDRQPIFGNIVCGQMDLNEVGNIVDVSWQWLGAKYPYLFMDNYVVLPDRLEGIVCIYDIVNSGSRSTPRSIKRKSLSSLIGTFKTVSTKRINQITGTPCDQIWQSNYYEHLIRNGNELNRVRSSIGQYTKN